jgi:anti-anti-sigma factor
MMIEAYQENGWTVLAVRGEVDRTVAPKLHNLLVDLCQEEGPAIALDLSSVDFSEGTRVDLALAGITAQGHGARRLVVVDVPERLHRLLATSGVDAVIDIR